MLDKKLIELDSIFHVDKLDSVSITHSESLGTLSLLNELNGLPLAFCSWEKLAELRLDELEIFVNKITNLVESQLTPEIEQMTVSDAILKSRELFTARLDLHNELNLNLKTELNEYTRHRYESILSDMFVSDDYIGFNVTSTEMLELRHFHILKNRIEFDTNMRFDQHLIYTGCTSEKYMSTNLYKLNDIFTAFIHILDYKDTHTRTLVKLWVEANLEYRSNKMLLSNWMIPWMKNEIMQSTLTQWVRTSITHDQQVDCTNTRAWFSENITNIKTQNSFRKRHSWPMRKLGFSNPIDCLAHGIYEIGFTDLLI